MINIQFLAIYIAMVMRLQLYVNEILEQCLDVFLNSQYFRFITTFIEFPKAIKSLTYFLKIEFSFPLFSLYKNFSHFLITSLFYLKQATQLAFAVVVFSVSCFFVYARIKRKIFFIRSNLVRENESIFLSPGRSLYKLKKLLKTFIFIWNANIRKPKRIVKNNKFSAHESFLFSQFAIRWL